MQWTRACKRWAKKNVSWCETTDTTDAERESDEGSEALADENLERRYFKVVPKECVLNCVADKESVP